MSWALPDGHQARYQLRSEAGAGPLALLQLIQFQLPARIFIVEPSTPPAAAKPKPTRSAAASITAKR
ncbi:hypothetical protein DB032_15705 [Chromobacterium sp. Panama]|nr:hypothetical protein DB032_15705 [Chromobacterium sp. Panama]